VIDRYGFTHLLKMSQFQVNRGLLIAVAKRWHLDHNTFYLPMGEMIVTPEDVYRIFWIPTIGDLVYNNLPAGGATFQDLFGDDSIGDDSVSWFQIM
jgi:hypothetical protein